MEWALVFNCHQGVCFQEHQMQCHHMAPLAPCQGVAWYKEDLDLMSVVQEDLVPYQVNSIRAWHQEDPQQPCHLQVYPLEALCTQEPCSKECVLKG